MDLDEIRKIEKVVDRLAASGPRKVRPPHCWFCGKLDAWFQCDCPDARDAQAGKRAKPRVGMRDGKTVIVLEPEVMAREHNRVWARYEAPKPAPVHAGVGSNPVNTDPVHAAVGNAAVNTSVTEGVHAPSDAEAARKAYRREWQRKKRAADLAAKKLP